MMPPFPLQALGRWLWLHLDGPYALRTTRLCIFAMMVAMWIAAYWAITTRGHLEDRLDEQSRLRDQEIATINLTLAHITDAIQAVSKHNDALDQALSTLADRVSRTEGRLDERAQQRRQ